MIIRHSPLAIAIVAGIVMTCAAQSAAPAKTLSSVVEDLGTNPDQHDSQWVVGLEDTIKAASLTEIKQDLPALVAFTESPNPQLRINALTVIYAIALRHKAGQPQSHPEWDPAGAEPIVPYLLRLAPRLTDSATPARSLSLLLFQAIAALLRPPPPELLTITLGIPERLAKH